MDIEKVKLDEEKVKRITKAIGTFPDFPKPGIIFKDIFAILRSPELFSDLISLMEDALRSIPETPEVIIGLDSRGFLFGPILALKMHVPFVPVRKMGKLPGKTRKVTYDLEYGTDTVEIQADAIRDDAKVAIVDDLIATGGTMAAACELVKAMNAHVCLCLAAIELTDLKGRDRIKGPVISISKF